MFNGENENRGYWVRFCRLFVKMLCMLYRLLYVCIYVIVKRKWIFNYLINNFFLVESYID